MKNNKKITLVIVAVICTVIASVFAITQTHRSTPLAPADESIPSSSEVVTLAPDSGIYLPSRLEETEPTEEEVSNEPTAEETTTKPSTTKPSTTKPTTTKPTTTKPTTTKPSTTKPTTTKPSTTKPTTTKPTTTKPTTTEPTTVAPGKVVYHYTDGTTGYTPKPGAEYYSNGCWNIVSWGNTVTDEEIKDAHENDSTDPWY